MTDTHTALTDPRTHTANIRQKLTDLAEHLREDIDKVDEPRAQALFETTREALLGLATAYEHYDEGKETAWRR